MACAFVLSWLVALGLGVVFTWILRGQKALSFTLGVAVVALLWFCFYIVPLRVLHLG
ncbi:hypothetical protein IAJ44_004242 [Salmonella enterica]|nr:hypothetical protein [Salmonella enterica]